MGNKRVFYACQGLMLNGKPLYGVQNLSISTTQNTNVVENWGSLAISGVPVDTPRCNINISRTLAEADKDSKSDAKGKYGPIETGSLEALATRHNHNLCVFFVKDTADGVNTEYKKAHPRSDVKSIGFRDVSINSISYTINVDGFLQEDVEMIAFNKEYDPTGLCQIAEMDLGEEDYTIMGNPIKREHFNSIELGEKVPDNIIQSIDISIPFNIQTVDEFGTFVSRHSNRYRFPTLPIKSTLSATVIYQNTADFDNYMFRESGVLCGVKPTDFPKSTGLSISTCFDFGVDLGNCILENIEYEGGDTSGGNATLTYQYSCYNSGNING